MKTIRISKSELKKLYYEMTAKELMTKLEVCSQTLYNMLDAAGIERKRKNFKRGENVKYRVVD